MSENKGSTWKKITSNLPDNTLLWRIVQDHINSNLFFLGTEFEYISLMTKEKNG